MVGYGIFPHKSGKDFKNKNAKKIPNGTLRIFFD